MILRGTRVVDFSHVLAGPHCGRQLADIGAEVIKVENIAQGDSVRHIGTGTALAGTVFANQNAGKLALAVDLTHPAGRQVALDLVHASDVVLENFRPGVMRRFGLDYVSLHHQHRRLVMCSISAFGQTGPMAEQPGFAYSAMAMSGALDLDRDPDGRPHIGHLPVADFLAAINAVAAIGFALLHRDRTGDGQYLDISLLDCMLAAEDLATPGVINGGSYTPQRRPGVSVHRVGDGCVVLMVTTSDMFCRFADAIGAPDLKADPRFVSRDDRIANQGQLDAIADQWIAAFPTRRAVTDFLTSHRVPCAAILSVQEATAQAQVRARGSLCDVAGADHALGRVVRSGMRFSLTPSSPQGPAPSQVGSHTNDILRRVLGYSTQQIGALVTEKVVHQA